MDPFKAYDIRGIWNKDLTPELVYKVGFFLPRLLKADTVLVGRVIRLSSPEIFSHLTAGILDAGSDVIDIGQATTPMVYFATVYFAVACSVQITASHNPAAYNGLKISRSGAVPVGGETGLEELEALVRNEEITPKAQKGQIRKADAKGPYLAYLAPLLPDFSALRLAIDCSNGAANLIVKELLGKDHIYLSDTIDGNFPDHEPNPLVITNCTRLQNAVIKNKADVGIIYDGDADRVNLIDEKGRYVFADITMAILAIDMLRTEKGIVVADIRSSRSAIDYIHSLGGKTIMWKVGHVNAKAKIRETGAIFGGELAGHYYFRDFFCCDSAMVATLHLLRVIGNLKAEGRTLSSLVDEIVKWQTTGELNFTITNKKGVLSSLYAYYAPQAEKVLDFDGYRFEFPTWWFSIRASNTEPYLRLVLEAKSAKERDEKLACVKAFIHD